MKKTKKKKYVKPVVIRQEIRSAGSGACGRMKSSGCGDLVVKS